MSKIKELTKGLIKENPTFVQLLGMCPTLAVTTSVSNGLGMGLSATAVLVASNTVISLLRKFIPQKIRIASYIVVIAGFVSIVEMLLRAFLPELSKTLGLFIPLIVVNCIVLGRAEAFASKNSPINSFLDGVGMGVGFTFAITLLAVCRELIGAGTVFGCEIMPDFYVPMILAILPPGAFVFLGFMLAFVRFLSSGSKGGRA